MKKLFFLLVCSIHLVHAAAWISGGVIPITAQTWKLFKKAHTLAQSQVHQTLKISITSSSHIQLCSNGGVTQVLTKMASQEHSDFLKKHPMVSALSSDYRKKLNETELILNAWIHTIPLGPTPLDKQTESLYNYLFCVHLATCRLIELEVPIHLCQTRHQVRYPEKLAHLILDNPHVELSENNRNRLAAIIIAELGAHEGAQKRDDTAYKLIENSWNKETF